MLRIILVNESELRRIADGKLRAPTWGFFNLRHAERYQELDDFARNFRKQLTKPAASTPKAAPGQKGEAPAPSKPDGGLIKRVRSQPSFLSHGRTPSKGGSPSPPGQTLSRGGDALPSICSLPGRGDLAGLNAGPPADAAAEEETPQDGGCEDACFLRLHIPHYVGHRPATPQVLVVGDELNAAAVAGLKKVRSASALGPAGGSPGSPARTFRLSS